MRVHGDKIIRRSTPKVKHTKYQNYRDNIREDFHEMCGYCGKIEKITSRGFEIDHFVPQNIDVSKKSEYNNLVYSCFTCNRKKGSKWPTKNSDLMHDGKVGILDPAIKEFDQHIERNEYGDIVGITDLGDSVCKKIFKFDKRPMKELYKCMQILEKKELLRQSINDMTLEETKSYIKIDEEIDNLFNKIFLIE